MISRKKNSYSREKHKLNITVCGDKKKKEGKIKHFSQDGFTSKQLEKSCKRQVI